MHGRDTSLCDHISVFAFNGTDVKFTERAVIGELFKDTLEACVCDAIRSDIEGDQTLTVLDRFCYNLCSSVAQVIIGKVKVYLDKMIGVKHPMESRILKN